MFAIWDLYDLYKLPHCTHSQIKMYTLCLLAGNYLRWLMYIGTVVYEI